MEQINNGFDERYYLCADGRIFDRTRERYINADKEHKFRLLTVSGERKHISLKPLYRLVYGANYCVDIIEDLEGEEWREIEDTNGFYLISNKGRVKSLFGYESLILKPTANDNGYLRVDINGTNTLIHKLVMSAFADPPKSILYQIHHKDFVLTHNELDNLCYLLPTEHRKIHAERRAKENGKRE